ncbi:hypothetical protein CONCODRAFT_2580 [Conidiobolus coronatus NRRL 28638]|uniref:Uncharacterized protein n=1 Tax=Conidiobolus coronatus (strain ATCC 28846 / CBS 209.66 / NRRL 28638) TaxID=796925 RepID=A0A137PH90_CONC2|nr:hypothetical protein CONCODRAFT_2580 [Conidiobolus coronatus NRRL 28638]|eukprot:KXN74376.1 hypothetical protein CONCODRAFT_2580 [Conidiobolus coronatus NRRL 28638]
MSYIPGTSISDLVLISLSVVVVAIVGLLSLNWYKNKKLRRIVRENREAEGNLHDLNLEFLDPLPVYEAPPDYCAESSQESRRNGDGDREGVANETERIEVRVIN